MKASVLSLCNNILWRAQKDKVAVTPMKLQKLLYYICAKYVQETGIYPILERFEVWRYGPVIPSVYSEFKSFRASPINKYSKDAKGQANIVDEDASPILRGCIDFIWGKYKGFTGPELARRTYGEGAGWYFAIQRNDAIIGMEDMMNDKTV